MGYKISNFALAPVKDTLLFVDYQLINNPTLRLDVNDKIRELSSNALCDFALGIPTRGCSIWKGLRSTVFSLFYKNIIGPFDKSCFALPFRSWRKRRNISSEICMSIVVSRLALAGHWESGEGW